MSVVYLNSLFSIDERKPINIPPDKTTDDYLAIQGNNRNSVPAYTHTPCIRVNVSVNNKLKGLYYCLIEDGVLFLDRNTDAEHSEYVISLGEYTFKAVNDFTIKLTKNELKIALLFSSKIDCDTWMECLTTARDSVYSYVPIQETTLTINKIPKRELDNFDKEILRCRSVDDILASKNTESSSCVYVDVSPICLENAQKAFEKRAESDKIRKSVNEPLFVTKNDFSSETLEEVRSTSYEQHLPEDLTKKSHSVTLPFQGLTRKPINIPPDKTTDDYLAIQGNNRNSVPAYTHTPCIRVNVTVNNKLKGMYYCLIEYGVLFIDRNTNAEHSEYVISLAEYTFKAVNNFTIKLTKNKLEIALLFSAKIDCDIWMEYLTTASDSVYSYVPIIHASHTRKIEQDTISDIPIRRCWSVEKSFHSKYRNSSSNEFIESSSLSLDDAIKSYEESLGSNISRNNARGPIPIPGNNCSRDPMEKKPKEGMKRFRRFLQAKSTPREKRNKLIQRGSVVMSYENIIMSNRPLPKL